MLVSIIYSSSLVLSYCSYILPLKSPLIPIPFPYTQIPLLFPFFPYFTSYFIANPSGGMFTVRLGEQGMSSL